MPRRIFALLFLVTFPASACHSYRYADRSEAVVGADVRVRLTPEETGRLQESVRVQNRQVEGTVTEGSGDDGLMIEAPVLNTSPRIYQRVRIPQDEIVDLEVSEFSRGKTALLVGALVAAVAAIGFTAALSDKNENDENLPPESERLLIPLFSFGTR